MPYLFFLGPIPLPITPSALTIKTPSMNKTVTLVNECEINIPKRSGLREISFEFLLPQVQKYPFANYQLGSYTASVMIPLLNMWKDTCIPFRFIVTRMSPSGGILYFTYIKCVIEDFEYNEDAEAHGLDVMCSINLKEYIDYGTKTVDVKEVQNQQGNTTQQATLTQTRPSKPVSSTVTARRGDNLTTIAWKGTGNPDLVYDIAARNRCALPVEPSINIDPLGELSLELTNWSPTEPLGGDIFASNLDIDNSVFYPLKNGNYVVKDIGEEMDWSIVDLSRL